MSVPTRREHLLSAEERARLRRLNDLSPHARRRARPHWDVPTVAMWLLLLVLAYWSAQAARQLLWGAFLVFVALAVIVARAIASRRRSRSLSAIRNRGVERQP